MTRKKGDVFEIYGVKLRVEEVDDLSSKCFECCYFKEIDCSEISEIRGRCSASLTDDGIGRIFVKVEENVK